jgi:hypothetical protein
MAGLAIGLLLFSYTLPAVTVVIIAAWTLLAIGLGTIACVSIALGIMWYDSRALTDKERARMLSAD